ncbi:MAG: hypothetical protein L0Y44_11050 [Phycisphaerales bacterium]|nr:hypothetical protein [Phycisphaerales bacterium]MCI0676916.1 hypothetical protein [Phycisphaerales bacterium]
MPAYDLRPEALTWTALLAQWVQFAQASLALPDSVDGPQWRASVPAIINLQAVTFALAELERLIPDDRPVALDKARILIDQSTRQLTSIWNRAPLSPALDEICEDAQAAFAAAAVAGHDVSSSN